MSHSYYHCAAMLSGLCELASDERISLRFVITDTIHTYSEDKYALCLNVSADGSSRRLAFDLHDSASQYSAEALQSCDLYFKRSCLSSDVAMLAADLKHKVRPFGLNYGTRTNRAGLFLLAALTPSLILAGVRHRRAALRVASLKKQDVKNFVSLPTFGAYEWTPDAPVEDAVVFQTRLWEADDVGLDRAEEVNEPRVALVRELRREFGVRFRGGLVPTPIARRLYPALLSTAPTRRGAYIGFAKRCLVAVSTRGLHHSLPFKVSEALASSKVLVTTPLRNELPTPLESGHHYVEFDERRAESCIAACASALENPVRAREFRRAAWDYYRREVQPTTHVMNLLERAFG